MIIALIFFILSIVLIVVGIRFLLQRRWAPGIITMCIGAGVFAFSGATVAYTFLWGT